MTTPMTISSTGWIRFENRVSWSRSPRHRSPRRCSACPPARPSTRRLPPSRPPRAERCAARPASCARLPPSRTCRATTLRSVGNRQVAHRLGGDVERVHQRNAARRAASPASARPAPWPACAPAGRKTAAAASHACSRFRWPGCRNHSRPPATTAADAPARSAPAELTRLVEIATTIRVDIGSCGAVAVLRVERARTPARP